MTLFPGLQEGERGRRREKEGVEVVDSERATVGFALENGPDTAANGKLPAFDYCSHGSMGPWLC